MHSLASVKVGKLVIFSIAILLSIQVILALFFTSGSVDSLEPEDNPLVREVHLPVGRKLRGAPHYESSLAGGIEAGLQSNSHAHHLISHDLAKRSLESLEARINSGTPREAPTMVESDGGAKEKVAELGLANQNLKPEFPEGIIDRPNNSAAMALERERLFSCLDGLGSSMPVEFLNDNYCDCADGSDETETAACAGLESREASRHNSHGHRHHLTSSAVDPISDAEVAATFACTRLAPGVPSQRIFMSRVGDGVCDCCDGADEAHAYPSTRCPDTCSAQRVEAKKALERLAEGLRVRHARYDGAKLPAGTSQEVRTAAKILGKQSVESGQGFGTLGGAILALAASCHSLQRGQFRYELCPLGRITQQEVSHERQRGRHGGSSGSSEVHVLGELWAWESDNLRDSDGRLRLRVFSHAGAPVCSEVGWARSAEVLLSCGPADVFIGVEELETCHYLLELETPAACEG